MISLDRIRSAKLEGWTGYDNYIEREYIVEDIEGRIEVINICTIKDGNGKDIVNGLDLKNEKVIETFPIETKYPTVVKFNNGLYGYKGKNGRIKKYRFDYATDFNSFGLAIACLNGKVFWMNKNFKFLRCDNFKFSEAFDLLYLNGCEEVYNFNYLDNSTLIRYGYYIDGVYTRNSECLTWIADGNYFIPSAGYRRTLKKSSK